MTEHVPERRAGYTTSVDEFIELRGDIREIKNGQALYVEELVEHRHILKGRDRGPGLEDDVRDLKAWRAASMARVLFMAKWAAGIAASVITAALIVYLAL